MFFGKEITGNIIFNNCEYSHRDVNIQVKRIMKKIYYLADNDKPIGIALPREVDLIFVILACLELHIPFVTIDINMPLSRINYMIDNVSISFVITKKNIFNKLNADLVFLDDINHADNYSKMGVNKSEVAYYLFTSGTSGNPKAVQIERSGLNNFIIGVNEVINFKENDRIACLTSPSFDIFFLESVLSMYSGLTVVLANDSIVGNVVSLCEFLKDESIDVLQITPSRIKMIEMVDPLFTSFKSIKKLLVGGEQFPINILKKLQEYTQSEIYNMYGPTETTIWSTISNLTDSNDVNIGKPIRNTQIYILDEMGNQVKEGDIGEICIAGSGLARGYYINEEANNKVFTYIYNTYITRIYHTGDLGSKNQDGILYCYGRIDSQVKINGHRIELDDIDFNIQKIKKIKHSVTCYNQNLQKLVTYYVPEQKIDNKEIINELKMYLPNYMIPSIYIEIDKIEYTVSGKVDRKAIVEKYQFEEISTNNSNAVIADYIVDLIQKELNYDVAPEDRIDALMLDSMTFIRLIVTIEDRYNIEFDEEHLNIEIFETIKDIISYIESNIN